MSEKNMYQYMTQTVEGSYSDMVCTLAPGLTEVFTPKAKSGGINIDGDSLRIAKDFDTSGRWYANNFDPARFGPFGLVMHFNNWSDRDLFVAFEKEYGKAPDNPFEMEKIKKKAEAHQAARKRQYEKDQKAKQTKAANWIKALWNDGKTVKAKQPGFEKVGMYLKGRGIDPKYLPRDVALDLRFNPGVYYNEEFDNGRKGVAPAMLARVRDKNWAPATIHRTYLSPNGDDKNRSMLDSKKVMPKAKDYNGGGIWLGKPAPHVVIAEGIENTLSGMVATVDKPHYCGIAPTCADLLAMLDLSQFTGIQSATIFADNDAKGVGQNAAQKLADNLAELGIQVGIKIPPNVGQDWNDCLKLLGTDDFISLVQSI